MSIWVRSQNKHSLLELNAIWTLGNKKTGYTELRGTSSNTTLEDDFWPLGEFASEEEAQKEIDYIQEWIMEARPKRVFIIGETMRYDLE